MIAFVLILFLAGVPLLTKFLVGMFSPKSSSSSSAAVVASSTAAKKVDESSKKKETPKNNTTIPVQNTTPPSSSTKDAPKVVVDQKPPVVVEKVVETKPAEIVIEKVTPIVVEEPVVATTVVVEEIKKVEEPVAVVTVAETPVETPVVQKEEENKVIEESVPQVVSETNELIPEEEPVAVVETPVETQVQKEETKQTSQQEEGEFVSNLNVEKSSFIIKPSHISKYLIGQKGATINKIKDETHSKIDMETIEDDSTLVAISANGEGFDLEKTYLRLRDELKVYGWEFDKNENQFVEHLTESMKLFKELEKKIQEQAQIMATSFENSKKAFEEGDKGLASQLSTEGKHAQSLMKQYQEESANVMYDHLNKDRPETEIDLHGQYVDAAMNFLKQRIEKLRGQSINQLTIIYGAGNHSDANGPKIKPAVLTYLKENNLTFEEQTQGSILANI